MRDTTGFWGWAMWIPAIICFVNLLQNAVYVWWSVYYLPAWTRIPTGRDRFRAGKSTRRALPDPKALKRIPRLFWFIVCTQILQAGVVGGFNGLSADIITATRGPTAQTAGYTSALQQVIPIFLTPSLGAFFDKFGYRMVFGVSHIPLSFVTNADGSPKSLSPVAFGSLCIPSLPSATFTRSVL